MDEKKMSAIRSKSLLSALGFIVGIGAVIASSLALVVNSSKTIDKAAIKAIHAEQKYKADLRQREDSLTIKSKEKQQITDSLIQEYVRKIHFYDSLNKENDIILKRLYEEIHLLDDRLLVNYMMFYNDSQSRTIESISKHPFDGWSDSSLWQKQINLSSPSIRIVAVKPNTGMGSYLTEFRARKVKDLLVIIHYSDSVETKMQSLISVWDPDHKAVTVPLGLNNRDQFNEIPVSLQTGSNLIHIKIDRVIKAGLYTVELRRQNKTVSTYQFELTK